MITVERLDKALAKLATIIDRSDSDGRLWPIFERLERQRDDLASRAARLKAARERVAG